MDELNKLKSDYLAELNVQYKNLINFLQAIPVNQQFKSHGFQNLDQGMMWFQKGIEIISIMEENKVPEKEPELNSENEIKTNY